jgi:hypothetical protein
LANAGPVSTSPCRHAFTCAAQRYDCRRCHHLVQRGGYDRERFLAAAITPLLAGCQESLDVERTHSMRAHRSTGRHRHYVEVRTQQGHHTPVVFVVDVEDLPQPPEGVDDDVEVVLEGDRCPDPAG